MTIGTLTYQHSLGRCRNIRTLQQRVEPLRGLDTRVTIRMYEGKRADNASQDENYNNPFHAPSASVWSTTAR